MPYFLRGLRPSSIMTARPKVGMSGTSSSRKFDGRGVKTIVFSKPNRRAIAGAARNDRAARMFVPKKMPPSVFNRS